MDKVLVSVIIPVYNTEKYIEQSVKSVLCQSYKNIEVILIDDGSTDNSFDECKRLSRLYNNVKVYRHEKNSGQEKTRNDGIFFAKGEWILFLDSDDTLEIDCIDYLIKATESHSCEIVFFDFSYIINNGITRISANIESKSYSKKEFVSHILVDIPWGFISCIGTKLYKSSFLRNNNIKFDAKYKYNEDGAFALEAIQNSCNIYYLNCSFYNYLVRESGSTQSSYRPNMFYTVRNVHSLLRDIIISNECNSDVWNQYYYQCAQFMYVCLKNEKQYKGFKKYAKIFYELKNDAYYSDVCKNIKRIKRIKYRLFLSLFKYGFKRLLYLFI